MSGSERVLCSRSKTAPTKNKKRKAGNGGKGDKKNKLSKRKAQKNKTPVPLGEKAPGTCDAPPQALQYHFDAHFGSARCFLENKCLMKEAACTLDGNGCLRDHFPHEMLLASKNPRGDGNCLMHLILLNFPDVLDKLVKKIWNHRDLYCHRATPDGKILLCTLLFFTP